MAYGIITKLQLENKCPVIFHLRLCRKYFGVATQTSLNQCIIIQIIGDNIVHVTISKLSDYVLTVIHYTACCHAQPSRGFFLFFFFTFSRIISLNYQKHCQAPERGTQSNTATSSVRGHLFRGAHQRQVSRIIQSHFSFFREVEFVLYLGASELVCI